jgi:hypothetical protein
MFGLCDDGRSDRIAKPEEIVMLLPHRLVGFATTIMLAVGSFSAPSHAQENLKFKSAV